MKKRNSHSCNRSNNQYNTYKPPTNILVRNDKKPWSTPVEASKEERKVSDPIFGK